MTDVDIAQKVGAVTKGGTITTHDIPKAPPATAPGKVKATPAKPPSKTPAKSTPKSSMYPDKTAAEVRQDRGLPAEVPAVRAELNDRRSLGDLRILRDMVKDCIVRGITETQACEELGIGVEEFRRHSRYVIEDLIRFYQDNTALQVYANYVLEQRGCIRELQLLIDNFKHSNQQTALVGAIKTKSDILNKVLEKGQDMGIVDRKAKRIEFIGSLDVRNMTEIDIARSIMGTIQEINELVEKGVVIDTEAVTSEKVQNQTTVVVQREKVA